MDIIVGNNELFPSIEPFCSCHHEGGYLYLINEEAVLIEVG